jgi:nitrite reductase/ring-hydroxylating ferredoxin subunit
MAAWQPIAKLDEVPEGRGIVVERASGPALAVFRAQGQVFVLDNRCPHRNGDLGAGDIQDCRVFCPLHAWSFDLRTGRSLSHPHASVASHPSRIRDGWIEAELEDVAPSGHEGEDDEPVDVPEEYR